MGGSTGDMWWRGLKQPETTEGGISVKEQDVQGRESGRDVELSWAVEDNDPFVWGDVDDGKVCRREDVVQ